MIVKNIYTSQRHRICSAHWGDRSGSVTDTIGHCRVTDAREPRSGREPHCPVCATLDRRAAEAAEGQTGA